MASAGASRGDGSARDGDGRGRTPAQWYCYVVGAVLLLVGVAGFFVDASFDTAGSGDPTAGTGNADNMLQGDGLLGFEVNGWHNVVHLLSGVVLLALASKRASAKAAAIGFGVVYGLVAIIGLINGNDVLGVIPVNAADNVLHVALSLLGLLAGFMSRADDRGRGGDRMGTPERARRDAGAGREGLDGDRDRDFVARGSEAASPSRTVSGRGEGGAARVEPGQGITGESSEAGDRGLFRDQGSADPAREPRA